MFVKKYNPIIEPSPDCFPDCFAVDVTTDAALSTVYYYYSGNLSNSFLGTYINGFLDGVVDVFQTFFTQ